MINYVILGEFTGIVARMTVDSIFNGYALSVLWGWFVAPAFGLPELSVVSAVAIAMIIGCLTKQYTGNKDDDISIKKMLKIVFVTILRPSFSLFFGYILHICPII